MHEIQHAYVKVIAALDETAYALEDLLALLDQAGLTRVTDDWAMVTESIETARAEVIRRENAIRETE